MKLYELDESLRTENPCWKGYHPVGTKKKAGRTVPNCVPESEGNLDEALTDANFRSAGEYKRYAIEVRKTPFVNPTTKEKFYIAQTTIGKDELKTKGASPEQAVDALQQKIDFMLNAASKVSSGATLDFNVKFVTQILHDPRAQFYAKIENRGGEPKLVIASPEMMDFGRELMQLGFKSSALRVDPESDRATPLPSISYSAKQIANTGLIANGRYEVGHMQKDDEGNMVFDLKYHSTAHSKSDKIRLSTPSFTVGSNRATESVVEGYGRYYCSTDKKWKTRQGPKQTRKSESIEVVEFADDLDRILELGGVNLTEDLTPDQQFDIIEEMVEALAEQHGVDSEMIWEDFESVDDNELYETAAWRRKEGKNKKGGLNAKGVASYRRENPGSKLQTAVTTKPSKLKPGSKAAKRRKSFCARMSGVKGPMKKPNGKPTRKALALRKWNC
jgi:hypothetical protein